MALSQLQCLDENHVNPRTHESKPDFLYCEDQRLALEVLLRDGREAFAGHLEARGLRGFLSELELEALTGGAEPFDPGAELLSRAADDGDDRRPLSLRYWPDLSDVSEPEMELGWPDTDAYRGVTRITVHTQPPLDGQTHIKEVVRKMIAQAQKVIAVVMDVFTDVDIFRDLLDAGFKRRVSVYILVERTTLTHFLSMCERADMHAGHLKHLRVRCSEGTGFYTRSSKKVRGQMGHRLMFIDGDKAVSGSYSFTWMSSRLDRHHITVVTGQAVDTFDQLFRCLYLDSSFVDLRQVTKSPEPAREPLPQPATVAPVSAAVARKLYNPKYALLMGGNPNLHPSPPADRNNPKDTETPEVKKKGRSGARKDDWTESPPLHPGLVDLEKACLMSYLPTWPEPDPPRDVIGFINIKDDSKKNQVHLQRSERFETSQAVRFSSPIHIPKEVLPEVATPRRQAAEPVKTELRPTKERREAGVEEFVSDGVQGTEHFGENGEAETNQQDASEPKSTLVKAASERHPHPVAEGETNSCASASHSPPRSRSKTPGSDCAQTKSETVFETSVVKDSTDLRIRGLNCSSNLKRSTDSNLQRKLKTSPIHVDAPKKAVDKHPQSSLELTPHFHNPTIHSPLSAATSVLSKHGVSTSLSENNHIPKSAARSVTTTTACKPMSSISASSSLPTVTTSLPTIPTSSLRSAVPQTQGEREIETSGEARPQEDDGNIVNLLETQLQTQKQQNKEKETSLEVGANAKAGSQTGSGTKLRTRSDAFITATQNVKNLGVLEMDKSAEETDPKSSMPSNHKTSPKQEFGGTEKRGTMVSTKEKVYLARAHVPQRISYGGFSPEVLDFGGIANQTHRPGDAPASAGQTNSQKGSRNISSKDGTESRAQRPSVVPPQSPQKTSISHTPNKTLQLNLSNTFAPDLHPPLVRAPTPDGVLPSVFTPDSGKHTPDSPPCTSTPATSDGYVSPRADSALSMTSDEFYECSECLSEPVSDRSATYSQRKADLSMNDSHTRRAPTSPVDMYSPCGTRGNTTEDPHIGGNDSSKISDQDKEAKHQVPKTKRWLNKAGVEKLAAEGASTRKGPEPKPSSIVEIKLKDASLQAETTDMLTSAGQMLLEPDKRENMGQLLPTRKTRKQEIRSEPLGAKVPKTPSGPWQVPVPRAGQSRERPPNPNRQASRLDALKAQPDSRSRDQTASTQEAPKPAEGKPPFSLSFGRLYNIGVLKDKMSRRSEQSRKSSAGSSGQEHKAKS